MKLLHMPGGIQEPVTFSQTVTIGEDAFSYTVAQKRLQLEADASGNDLLRVGVVADATPRLAVTGSGALSWSDGNDPVDTNLYREAADTLRTDDVFRADEVGLGKGNVNASTAPLVAYGFEDAVFRLLKTGNNAIALEWAAAGGAWDTNLYRPAANRLQTDDELYIGPDAGAQFRLAGENFILRRNDWGADVIRVGVDGNLGGGVIGIKQATNDAQLVSHAGGLGITVKAGTNANTVKLVANAGGADTTILDNIPTS